MGTTARVETSGLDSGAGLDLETAPACAPAGTPGDVVARIERAPMSRWHVKVRAIVGIATFFDGFDTLMISYVLPILAPQWHLTGPEIGLMVSAGFVGQMLATLLFGFLAERFGRIRVLAAATALFAVMSCACAFAWDYNSLLVLRTVQGFGIGAEVPIAITYIAELAKAANRARFIVLYELVFPAGLVASVLVGWFVVPILGWRWLFIFGGVPALLIAALQLRLPESPRWLAARGRFAEADQAMTTIETEIVRATGRPLPAPQARLVSALDRKPSWADLFGPIYLPRTIGVWVVWFATFLLNYSLVTWLPTLYRTMFQLSVTDSLGYTVVTSVVGLLGTAMCAFIFDVLPRRLVFAASFMLAGIPLFWMWLQGVPSAQSLLTLATTSYFFISILSMGSFVYTTEIYSNRVRAIGMTTASTFSKIASILGPILVGLTVGTAGGVGTAFLVFSVVAVIAAIVAALLVVETRGRTFEEVSP